MEKESKTLMEIIQEKIPEAKKIKQRLDSWTWDIVVEFYIKRKKYTINISQLDFELEHGNKIELRYSKRFEEYQKEIIEVTKPIKEKYKDMLENKNKDTEWAASEFSKKVVQEWIDNNL